MSNALIDNTTSVQYIASWDNTAPPKPVFNTYPNSARVCQVSSESFDVAPPLFWVTCNSSITADQWYYDLQDATIKPVINAPEPELAALQDQPAQTGAEQF